MITGSLDHEPELAIAGFEFAVAGWLSRGNEYKNESTRVRNQKLRQKESEKKILALNSCRHEYHSNHSMGIKILLYRIFHSDAPT